MAPADLQVRDLHAYYGSAHVLFGVSLDVPAGATLALLGRNGAGKTTVMRAVTGAGVRATGQVSYGSANLAGLPPYRVARAGVQLVPEDRRVFTRLTVRDNLLLAAQGADSTRPARTLAEITGMFPMLTPLLHRPGYALSGGEQQLLAIARAMVARPTLLLLDEPSEGLAPRITEQVGEAIRGLREAGGLSVLLAEQNTRFAMELADAVCLIDAGRVVWAGSPEELRRSPDLLQRYLAV